MRWKFQKTVSQRNLKKTFLVAQIKKVGYKNKEMNERDGWTTNGIDQWSDQFIDFKSMIAWLSNSIKPINSIVENLSISFALNIFFLKSESQLTEQK